MSSHYPPQSYQQGYAPQQQSYAPQRQTGQQQLQTVKFYKSGLFLLASAAGRLERDVPQMEAQGWKLQYAAALGMNILLRRIIIAVWTRG